MNFTGWASLDIETHGQKVDSKGKARVNWRTDHLTSFAWKGYQIAEACFYPHNHKDSDNRSIEQVIALLNHLFDVSRCLVLHNSKYDLKVIEKDFGLTIPWEKVLDTMVLARMLSKGVPVWRNGQMTQSYGLKDLVRHHFGHQMPTFTETTGVVISGPQESEIEIKVALERRRILDSRISNTRIKKEWTRACSEQLLRFERMFRKDQVVRNRQMDELTAEEAGPYCCSDAEWTLKLGMKLWQEASDEERRYYHTVDKWSAEVAGDMEGNGWGLDFDRLMKLRAGALVVAGDAAREWEAQTGTKITSAPQIRDYLYMRHECPDIPSLNREPIWEADAYTPMTKPPKGSKSKPQLSVGKAAIAWAMQKYPEGTRAHELAKLKLRFTEVAKIVSTYSTSLIDECVDGRFYPSINIIGTDTGRWSCSRLHQIPRPSGVMQVRSAFIAPVGWSIVAGDFSGFEIAIMAHMSQDPVLLDIVRSGKSMHDVTAASLGIDRHTAKTLNLAVQYGAKATKIALTIGKKLLEKQIRDRETGKWKMILVAPREVEEMLESWEETYSGLIRWKAGQVEFCRKNGYTKTMFGRRRYLPDINHRTNWIRWAAERQACNHPIQGTAGDIIKIAGKKVKDRIKEIGNGRVLALLQVHDELDYQIRDDFVDEWKTELKDLMGGCVKLSVPLIAEVKSGKSWADAH